MSFSNVTLIMERSPSPLSLLSALHSWLSPCDRCPLVVMEHLGHTRDIRDISPSPSLLHPVSLGTELILGLDTVHSVLCVQCCTAWEPPGDCHPPSATVHNA